jgi:hypothetical protein
VQWVFWKMKRAEAPLKHAKTSTYRMFKASQYRTVRVQDQGPRTSRSVLPFQAGGLRVAFAPARFSEFSALWHFFSSIGSQHDKAPAPESRRLEERQQLKVCKSWPLGPSRSCFQIVINANAVTECMNAFSTKFTHHVTQSCAKLHKVWVLRCLVWAVPCLWPIRRRA